MPFLLKIINKLDSHLIRLLSRGDEKYYHIVIAILLNYDGASEINNICKHMITYLPKESELLMSISHLMQNTGVLTGEFGLAKALQEKKKNITPWLNDESLQVQEFTKKYIADLDKRIINEQRQSEENIELRKRSS